MGTLNAFYIRAHGDAVLKAIHSMFPEAVIDRGEDFLGVTLPGEVVEPPPLNELAQLSSKFETELIWLSFRSFVDAFQFYHWRRGSLRRSLVYGCYETDEWNLVEGQPEPWESEAFFGTPMLHFLVTEARTEEEKRDYERMWHDKQITPGSEEPFIDARESARSAAKYYNFPGWQPNEGATASNRPCR
jgi:hypothetical protein